MVQCSRLCSLSVADQLHVDISLIGYDLYLIILVYNEHLRP